MATTANINTFLRHLIVFIGVFVSLSLQRNIRLNKNYTVNLIEAYLHKYGYLDTDDHLKVNYHEYLSEAVSDFQLFANLPVTGSVDKSTLNKMLVFLRCGVKDIVVRNNGSHYNYQTVGQWNKRDLTWNISHYHPELDVDLQMEIIRKAFQYWSNVTSLTFKQILLEEPDIDIQFIREEHEDGNNFDGKGGSVAHAYFPGKVSISGDIHFDEDEEWSLFQNGTSLLAVAVHELGHSLGLGHSQSAESVMNPFFKDYNENFTLHQDDIDGIQSLYNNDPGKDSITSMSTNITSTSPISSLTNSQNMSSVVITSDPWEDFNGTTTTTQVTVRPTTNTHKKRCHHGDNKKTCRKQKRKKSKHKSKKTSKKSDRGNAGSPDINGEYKGSNENETATYSTGHVKRKICHMKFDAVIDGFNKRSYAFRNHYIYEIASGNITRRKIRALLRKAPVNISSAVFHPVTKELLIFKGKQIWKYNGKKLKKGYPQNITDTQYHEPSASILWYTGLILQFKDDMFWFWNDHTLRVSEGYPRSIKLYWPNLPTNVDAAVWYKQNNIYFFKDSNYYKLDSATRSIENGYPRPLAPAWLNCRSSKRATLH